MTNIILVFLGVILGVMLTIIISCILIEQNDMDCRYGGDDMKVIEFFVIATAIAGLMIGTYMICE